MFPLSDRLAALSPSETLAMSQKSNELKAQGVDVINLSVGETDFFTPDHVKEAAKKAIDENYSFYSPVPGYPALRNAICAKLKKGKTTWNINQTKSFASNGAKQSVCNVLLAIINKGDEVIIPAPYWVSYPEMVKLTDGTSVIVSASIDQDFKMSPAQLEAAITPKTKALILCSPSNPTGSVYTKEELKGLADVLAKYPNIYILSDEIYEHINYLGAHESIAQFEKCDRVIIINGVSKGYAMTGWRIGWIAGPKWIASACNTLQGQYTSGPNSVAQKAAEAAYTGDQSFVKDMQVAFKRRKNLVMELASQVPGFIVSEPKGAFYIFPDAGYYIGKSYGDRKIENSGDLAMYLLEVAHVACVGGGAFGAPTCLRLSYATSDDNLIKAYDRIKEALAKLK